MTDNVKPLFPVKVATRSAIDNSKHMYRVEKYAFASRISASMQNGKITLDDSKETESYLQVLLDVEEAFDFIAARVLTSVFIDGVLTRVSPFMEITSEVESEHGVSLDTYFWFHAYTGEEIGTWKLSPENRAVIRALFLALVKHKDIRSFFAANFAKRMMNICTNVPVHWESIDPFSLHPGRAVHGIFTRYAEGTLDAADVPAEWNAFNHMNINREDRNGFHKLFKSENFDK